MTDVQSTDPDGTTEGEGGLTYSLTGGADQAKFTIVAEMGFLTFTDAPDFENPTDSDADNVYNVQVTVTDPGGATDVQDIAVTVTDVNEAPTITSDGGGSNASITAAENQIAVTDVQSTDPDGTTEGAGGLTYAITGGADQAMFSIVANTGVLTFNTAPNFENPTDNGGNNVYDVQVTVTDPVGATDVQDIAVEVTNVNEDPVIDMNPSAWGNQADIEFRIGPDRKPDDKNNFIMDVNASDPDVPDTLTYSISDGNTNDTFTIDSSTGTVTLAKDWADAGVILFDLQIRVTDAAGAFDEGRALIWLEDTSVGITGDTQAIEGTDDDIELKFVRQASDEDQVNLSGDYDANGVEVWTLVMEQAFAQVRIPNRVKLTGWVVLRNPAHTAKQQPQTAFFTLARRQLEANAGMHWSKRPPVLEFSSTGGIATTSALFDATGPSYALVEGQVFPFYDQVLLVKNVGLDEVTLELVNDRIPKELRPPPRTRIIPMNLQHAAIFYYKTEYMENAKKLSIEAYDLVRVLKIDGDSGEAQIRLTPKTKIGVKASASETVVTVSKGGLLSAHGISYRVLNIVPPQNLTGAGQLVGWVELGPDPVTEK